MAKHRLKLVGTINAKPNPPGMPDRPGEQVVSVSDLIDRCNRAADLMSGRNHNKLLLLNAAYAMRQMVDRMAAMDTELKSLRANVNFEGTAKPMVSLT